MSYPNYREVAGLERLPTGQLVRNPVRGYSRRKLIRKGLIKRKTTQDE